MRISLFEVLRPWLEGARGVDLFAGTGCLGIEALSRGAGRVLFFDVDRRAIEAVRKNLDRLGFADRGEALEADAFTEVERLAPADLVFVDPPYDYYVDRPVEMRQLVEKVLGLILPEGRMLLEHRPGEGLGEVAGGKIVDERRYGGTIVTFYSRG
jgi:16S rRNA (guanine(966)-N(2))-methyltransferase RsmD